MCGRYIRKILQEDIIKHFDLVDGRDYFDIHGYQMSAEVFPGEDILVINSDREFEDRFWTVIEKDNQGNLRRVINAKAENVLNADMFRDHFKTGRCLVPASGFYEWDASKQRYEFTFDDEIIAFGGIARPSDIKGETRNCSVVITVPANDVVRPIHPKDRMPLIVRKHDYERWLDPATPLNEVRQMMRPWPSSETHAQNAAEPQEKTQGSLF